MPTHHNLDRYLEEYILASGITDDRKSPLFRTIRGRSGLLTANPLLQPNVWRMIRRRASAAGIKTKISCHTFRATGITAYLKNGGKLEIAQQMAAHESARTTGLYDRRDDEVSLDEVERIGILPIWNVKQTDLDNPLSVANRQRSLLDFPDAVRIFKTEPKRTL
jgi:integrase/recombinase XerD